MPLDAGESIKPGEGWSPKLRPGLHDGEGKSLFLNRKKGGYAEYSSTKKEGWKCGTKVTNFP